MNDVIKLYVRFAMVLTAIGVSGACAGCGDDDVAGTDGSLADAGAVLDDAQPPRDAGADAANEDAAIAPDAGASDCTATRLLVTTSDYVTGGLGTTDLGLAAAMLAPGTAADQDTTPHRLGCGAALLEHGLGNVRIQDRASPLTTLRTINVNPAGMAFPYASNPAAIVSLSDTRAYVVRLGVSSLAVIDPTRDGAAGLVGEVDLSALAATGDTDSVDATDAILVGDRVFVALGRYAFDAMFAVSFPEGSVLAVVDPAADTLVDADTTTAGMQGIALTGDNPRAGLYHDAVHGQLLVGDTGAYAMLDGGVEAVDLTTLRTTGFLLTETELGADLDFFVASDATHAFVVAGGVLRAWNPETRTLGATLVASDVSAIGLAGDTLYVAARMGASAGIRAFRASDGIETTPASGPVGLGALPVYGLVAVP